MVEAAGEDRFERLTRLARLVFGVPVAQISRFDPDPRDGDPGPGSGDSEAAFADAATAGGDDPLVIEDAGADPRFRDHPLVTGEPYIRFYAGLRLRGPDGRRWGTLALIDQAHRRLDEAERRTLCDLGALAESELAAVADQDAVRARLESEAHLGAILNSVGEAIATLSATGTVLSVNAAAERMFGHSEETLIGQSLSRLISREGHRFFMRRLGPVAAGSRSAPVELTREVLGVRADGALFPMEMTVTSLVRDDQLMYVAAARDITGRKHAEVEVATAMIAQQQVNSELERLIQAKSDFVSMISHEFRTALTGIQGFSELMLDGGFSAKEMREYAADINKDAHRLNRMIDEVLDIERLESGRITLNLEPADLSEILREAAARAAAAGAARHRVELELAEVPAVCADRDKLTQVVSNLLNNAIKYSPDGGYIWIQSRRDGPLAHVRVSDQGLGIPRELLDTIFERFTRADGNRLRHINGTGRGLPIAKQIVALHGGTIWAESQGASGSTFHFTVPLVEN